MEHDIRWSAFNIIRALIRDLGPTAANIPSVMRANEFLVRLLPVAEPIDAPREYVVYMEFASGSKKYDPAEMDERVSTFDKESAKRFTEAEARKRVRELANRWMGENRLKATFRYEKA